MGLFGDYTPTGIGIRGPASDLVELEDAKKSIFLAIWFHEDFLEDDALHQGVDMVRDFMEMPMAGGVVELKQWVPKEGLFVYPTGTVWSVAELLVILEDLDELLSVKATLELVAQAGSVLVDAAEAGEAQGVHSHGGLTPHRICVDADGQVSVIGYGLPQVEILAYLDDEEYMPTGRSFRYCPPERLEGAAEEASSDLFALALIAAELVAGEAIYPGKGAEASKLATEGNAVDRLEVIGEDLSDEVFEALATALAPYPDERFETPEAFVSAIRALAENAAGESLVDFMTRMKSEARVDDVDLPEDSEDPPAEAEADEAVEEDPPSDESAFADVKSEVSGALADTEAELKAAKAALKKMSKAMKSAEDPSIVELRKDAESFVTEVENAVKDLKDILKEVEGADDLDAALDLAQEAGELADNVAGITNDIEDRCNEGEALLAEIAEEDSAAEEAAAKKAEEEAAAKKAEEEAAAKKAEEEAAAKKAEEEAAAKKAEEEAAAKKAEEERLAAEEAAAALKASKKEAAKSVKSALKQIKQVLDQANDALGSKESVEETQGIVEKMATIRDEIVALVDQSEIEDEISSAEDEDAVSACVGKLEAAALNAETQFDAFQVLVQERDEVLRAIAEAAAAAEAEAKARAEAIQAVASEALDLVKALTDYKKRAAKAEAIAQKLETEEAQEIAARVSDAVSSVTETSKTCTAKAKAIAGVETVEAAQAELREVEDMVGAAAEQTALAEQAAEEATGRENEVLAAAAEAERVAAVLKMKRAEAGGLFESVNTTHAEAEKAMEALDGMERSDAWGQAWDEAHQHFQSLVETVDAAQGVLATVNDSQEESEVLEGVSDLNGLDEQADADSVNVIRLVGEIGELHRAHVEAEEAKKERLAALVAEAKPTLVEALSQSGTLDEVLSDVEASFDSTVFRDQIAELVSELEELQQSLESSGDVESSESIVAEVVVKSGAVKACFAALAEAVASHEAALLAARQEAEALAAAQVKVEPLRLALSTLLEDAQGQLDRLTEGLDAVGREGAESAEVQARETIEELKRGFDESLERLELAESLITSAEVSAEIQGVSETAASLEALNSKLGSQVDEALDLARKAAKARAEQLDTTKRELVAEVNGVGEQWAPKQAEWASAIETLGKAYLAAELGTLDALNAAHGEFVQTLNGMPVAEQIDGLSNLDGVAEQADRLKAVKEALARGAEAVDTALNDARRVLAEAQEKAEVEALKAVAEGVARTLEGLVEAAGTMDEQLKSAAGDVSAWMHIDSVSEAAEALSTAWAEWSEKRASVEQQGQDVLDASESVVAAELLVGVERSAEQCIQALAGIDELKVKLEAAAQGAEAAEEEAARKRLEALAEWTERAQAVYESMQLAHEQLKTQVTSALGALESAQVEAPEPSKALNDSLNAGQDAIERGVGHLDALKGADEPDQAEQHFKGLEDGLGAMQALHEANTSQVEAVETAIENELERRRAEQEALEKATAESAERLARTADQVQEAVDQMVEAFDEATAVLTDTPWEDAAAHWTGAQEIRQEVVDGQNGLLRDIGDATELTQMQALEAASDEMAASLVSRAREATGKVGEALAEHRQQSEREEKAVADAKQSGQRHLADLAALVEHARAAVEHGGKELAESMSDDARAQFAQVQSQMQGLEATLEEGREQLLALEAAATSQDALEKLEALNLAKESLKAQAAETEEATSRALKSHRDAASAADALAGMVAEIEALCSASAQLSPVWQQLQANAEAQLNRADGAAGEHAMAALGDAVNKAATNAEVLEAVQAAAKDWQSPEDAEAPLDNARAASHAITEAVEEAERRAAEVQAEVEGFLAERERAEMEALATTRKALAQQQKGIHSQLNRAEKALEKAASSASDWTDVAVQEALNGLQETVEQLRASAEKADAIASEAEQVTSSEDAASLASRLNDVAGEVSASESAVKSGSDAVKGAIQHAKQAQAAAQKEEKTALKAAMKSLSQVGKSAEKSLAQARKLSAGLAEDVAEANLSNPEIESAIQDCERAVGEAAQHYDALVARLEAGQGSERSEDAAQALAQVQAEDDAIRQCVERVAQAAQAGQDVLASAMLHAEMTGLKASSADVLQAVRKRLLDQQARAEDALTGIPEGTQAELESQVGAVRTANEAIAKGLNELETLGTSLADAAELPELQTLAGALESFSEDEATKLMEQSAASVAQLKSDSAALMAERAAQMEAAEREEALRTASVTRAESQIQPVSQSLSEAVSSGTTVVQAVEDDANSAVKSALERLQASLANAEQLIVDGAACLESIAAATGEAERDAQQANIDQWVQAADDGKQALEEAKSGVQAAVESQRKEIAERAALERGQRIQDHYARGSKVLEDAKAVLGSLPEGLEADAVVALSGQADQLLGAGREHTQAEPTDEVERAVMEWAEVCDAHQQRVQELASSVAEALEQQENVERARREELAAKAQEDVNHWASLQATMASEWDGLVEAHGKERLEDPSGILERVDGALAAAQTRLESEACDDTQLETSRSDRDQLVEEWAAWQKSQLQRIEQEKLASEEAAKAKAVVYEALQENLSALNELHEQAGQNVSDLKGKVEALKAVGPAVVSAVQAAQTALDAMGVEVDKARALAASVNADAELDALKVAQSEMSRAAKAMSKSKSVLDAAVESGLEAAAAEDAQRQQAAEKEQQRMTSAFSAGGLLMERLKDAVDEMLPWRAEFEAFPADEQLAELSSAFHGHMELASNAMASGTTAFESSQNAGSSEETAGFMAELREAVDVAEEANELAEELVKAARSRAEAVAESEAETPVEEEAPNVEEEAPNAEPESEEVVQEPQEEVPAADKDEAEADASETASPRDRLSRLRRGRRAGGARRAPGEEGEGHDSVSRSDRLERLRRARRTRTEPGAERPRRRRRSTEDGEAQPRRRRRAGEAGARPRRRARADGEEARPRRRLGASQASSDRMSRLRSRRGSAEGDERPRRRRPRADGDARPVRSRRPRREAGEGGGRRVRRRPDGVSRDGAGSDRMARLRRRRGQSEESSEE